MEALVDRKPAELAPSDLVAELAAPPEAVHTGTAGAAHTAGQAEYTADSGSAASVLADIRGQGMESSPSAAADR